MRYEEHNDLPANPVIYQPTIHIENSRSTTEKILVWGAAALGFIGMHFMNADVHVNDPVNRGKATSELTGLDVRTMSGYLGWVPMYAVGRGEKDVLIGNKPFAISAVDTKVGLYFPDMLKLHPEWERDHITVRERDDTGNPVSIDISRLMMEPLLGDVCETQDSAGMRIFTCKDNDPSNPNYVGRIDVTGNSQGLLSSDSDIIDSSLTSLNLLLTDKNCLEQYILKPNGIDFTWVMRAAVRKSLAARYNIPASMVGFDMGPLSLNPSGTEPLSQRLAEAHAQDHQVVSPFDDKVKGDQLNQWCSQTATDASGGKHAFIDMTSLQGFIAEVQQLGGETVPEGVFPDPVEGIRVDTALDQKRRQELPNELANNEIRLF